MLKLTGKLRSIYLFGFGSTLDNAQGFWVCVQGSVLMGLGAIWCAGYISYVHCVLSSAQDSEVFKKEMGHLL